MIGSDLILLADVGLVEITVLEQLIEQRIEPRLLEHAILIEEGIGHRARFDVEAFDKSTHLVDRLKPRARTRGLFGLLGVTAEKAADKISDRADKAGIGAIWLHHAHLIPFRASVTAAARID